MPEEKITTTEERRLQKIAQIKARLQREEALLNQGRRKERNGQLIAFGLLVEEVFKNGDETVRQRLFDSAKKYLKDRNLERALTGFERLAKSS